MAYDYYNIQTKTKIKQKGHKKFDSGHTTVEELARLLEQGNYQELANLPSKNNQPLQMFSWEDKDNKTFYILLMKYFPPSDFRGVTPVKSSLELTMTAIKWLLEPLMDTKIVTNDK